MIVFGPRSGRCPPASADVAIAALFAMPLGALTCLHIVAGVDFWASTVLRFNDVACDPDQVVRLFREFDRFRSTTTKR